MGTWENAPLMLNPKLMLKLPLRLKPIPLPGIMVVTTDTPTDTADTMVWDTAVSMVVTTVTPIDTADTMVWDTAVTMVDTTVIVMDTDTVTGDKGLLQIRTPILWSLLVVIYQ